VGWLSWMFLLRVVHSAVFALAFTFDYNFDADFEVHKDDEQGEMKMFNFR
jgi:hypothetical protein